MPVAFGQPGVERRLGEMLLHFQMAERMRIWTVGHSNRDLELFLEILRAHQIAAIVDVRKLPGSRRYPHFNDAILQPELARAGIAYHHFADLGGRRSASKESLNTAWRHPAFRGYADYMQTPAFLAAVDALQALAARQRVAYMCAEAVWWQCHRALISDWLKSRGWEVLHIYDQKKTEEHPYTSAARLQHGRLTYVADAGQPANMKNRELTLPL